MVKDLTGCGQHGNSLLFFLAGKSNIAVCLKKNFLISLFQSVFCLFCCLCVLYLEQITSRESQVMEAQVMEGQVMEPQVVEGQVVEGQVVEAQMVEGQVVESQMVEGQVVESQVVEESQGGRPSGEGPSGGSQVVESLLGIHTILTCL